MGAVKYWDGSTWQYAAIGPMGPPGPPGDGSASSYFYTQVSPSTSWLINHNLNFRPSVDVYDNNGLSIEGHVIHHTLNQLEIQFFNPRAGVARLS